MKVKASVSPTMVTTASNSALMCLHSGGVECHLLEKPSQEAPGDVSDLVKFMILKDHGAVAFFTTTGVQTGEVPAAVVKKGYQVVWRQRVHLGALRNSDPHEVKVEGDIVTEAE